MQGQPANTIDTETFAQSVIPKLIGNKTGLRVLFSTYNEVTGYDNGVLTAADPNLKIVIAAGGAQPPSFGRIFNIMDRALMAVAVGDFRIANRVLDDANLDALQGQASVVASLSDQVAKDGYPDVAVIYAGYSAFHQAITTVTDLHKESPDTFIVVLTCDCDLDAKKWGLSKIDGIGAIIVTPRCGGRGDMRDLLEAFLHQWPNRVMPAQPAA